MFSLMWMGKSLKKLSSLRRDIPHANNNCRRSKKRHNCQINARWIINDAKLWYDSKRFIASCLDVYRRYVRFFLEDCVHGAHYLSIV